jgi:L,D-peptidoglycan transpeptidase YkuD (ErfK/YbiS/YcfS/YnhG family)
LGKKYGPISCGIGRNGFAKPDDKIEGDGKSPAGLFGLGLLFCFQAQVDTRLDFIQTSSDDKWIDDPASEDYNRYVRGATPARSYERLRLRSDDYKYCMAIEYNMNPVVKGKGSAIFLHLGVGSTAGCVAINEPDMVFLLRWLKNRNHSRILMGNKNVLRQSF